MWKLGICPLCKVRAVTFIETVDNGEGERKHVFACNLCGAIVYVHPGEVDYQSGERTTNATRSQERGEE
jgi:hypothetical protein